MDAPASPYRCRPWRAAVAVAVGWPLLAALHCGALLLAYRLEQGTIAGAAGAPGSSYLADDLHDVMARSGFTVLVGVAAWALVHHYGRRGPIAAFLFALAAGGLGSHAISREAGPLGPLGQYLAYAGPVLVATLVMWRIAYVRARPGFDIAPQRAL